MLLMRVAAGLDHHHAVLNYAFAHLAELRQQLHGLAGPQDTTGPARETNDAASEQASTGKTCCCGHLPEGHAPLKHTYTA